MSATRHSFSSDRYPADRPVIEGLEQRVLLAASAAVVGSDLVITGDPVLADAITVTKAGNVYTLGGSVVGVFTASGNLRANLGGGDDNLSLTNVYVGDAVTLTPGNVTIDAGDGNDVIVLSHVDGSNLTVKLGEGVNTLTVYKGAGGDGSEFTGKATVTGGSGGDIVSFQNAWVHGAVSLKMGDGINQVYATAESGFAAHMGSITFTGGAAEDDLIMSGGAVVDTKITFKAGAGDNELACDASACLGAVSFITGGGSDVFMMTGSSQMGVLTLNLGLGANSALVSNSTVTGNITVRGGGITTDTSTVQGNISVTMPLAGSVGIIQTAVSGKLAVTGNEGVDTVNIASSSMISGTTTLKLGAGANIVALTNSTLSGKATINAAEGDDTVTTSTCTLVSGMTARLGDGGNQLSFTNSVVNAPLSYTGGQGDDTVWTGASTILAGLTMSGGKGANAFTLNNSVITGDATFKGGGDDNVDISNASTITGNLKSSVGSGANMLIVEGSTVVGLVSWTGGSGVDNVLFSGGQIGAATLNLGAGNNIVNINGATDITRTLSLTAAGGDDSISINAATFNQAVVIRTGGGDDVTSLLRTVAYAPVTIDVGAGNDIVNILNGGGVTRLWGPTLLRLGAGDDNAGLGATFDDTVTIDGGTGTDIAGTGGSVFNLAGQPVITNVP